MRMGLIVMVYNYVCAHGPAAGAGKSTTIFHIIAGRVPPGARVLVTCSRNVAVESIAQKLERCTDDRMDINL